MQDITQFTILSLVPALLVGLTVYKMDDYLYIKELERIEQQKKDKLQKIKKEKESINA